MTRHSASQVARATPSALATLLSLLVSLGAAPAAGVEGRHNHRWFVTSLGGNPVGYVHEETRWGPEEVVTRTELRIVLNRLGERLEMATSTVFREAPNGALRSLRTEVEMSEQVTVTEATVESGKLRIRERAGESVFPRVLETGGELLGPEGARQRTREQLEAAGDELRYRTFSPELGKVTEVTRTVLEAPASGTGGAALRVEEVVAAAPSLAATLWLDADARLLRSRMPGPFGELELVLSDAVTAKLAAGGAELPEESYGATLARTQIRVPKPRELEEIELRLRHRNPALGWPELASPAQEVLARSEGELRLAVRRPRPPEGRHTFPVPPTEELRPYLAANAYLQSEEPRLRELARDVAGEEGEIVPAMAELERWVAENLRFDLGVVLAPSVEVFENRRGTCTEYSVLLTTLARSLGIPARLALGYVYVDGAFGGHAWTEVRVGDRWIPFDAAVVRQGPADAGRFAFLWSSLAEGAGELSFGPAVQMFGQIDVEVTAFRHHGGPRVEVPDGATPYELTGGGYRNPWLGVELTAPEGFRFVDLDRVWPDPTVLGLEGPQGRRIHLRLERHAPWEDPREAVREALEEAVPAGRAAAIEVGGRTWPGVHGSDAAALAIPDGEEIWLLTAEGPGAAELLEAAAARLELTATRGPGVARPPSARR